MHEEKFNFYKSIYKFQYKKVNIKIIQIQNRSIKMKNINFISFKQKIKKKNVNKKKLKMKNIQFVMLILVKKKICMTCKKYIGMICKNKNKLVLN